MMADRTSPVDDEHRSVGTLLSDAMNHVSSLIRKEVALAKAEANEAVGQVATAIGLLVFAVVASLTALHVLCAALVGALTRAFQAAGLEAGAAGFWAALIVGGVLALIAAVAIFKGINDLKASNLAPNRTINQLQKDAETVKEMT